MSSSHLQSSDRAALIEENRPATQQSSSSVEWKVKLRRIIVVCAASLIIFVSLVNPRTSRKNKSPTHSGCTIGDKSFQYFKLVLQWPPAFGTDIGLQKNYWTIHGLWPSRIDSAEFYPCTCTNEVFDISSIHQVMEGMEKFWPSLNSNNNAAFWAHEWEKHGTCCSPYLTSQVAYFNNTIRLRATHDPGSLLSQFTPSDDSPYAYELLDKALGATGAAILQCNAPGTVNQYLSGAVLCMTASSKPSQFACPPNVKNATYPRCDPDFPVWIRPSKTPNV